MLLFSCAMAGLPRLATMEGKEMKVSNVSHGPKRSLCIQTIAAKQFINGTEYVFIKNMLGRFERSFNKTLIVQLKSLITSYEKAEALNALPNHLKRREGVAC